MPSRQKERLGIRAKVHKVFRNNGVHELREPSIPYGVHFRGKKEDMGPENTYFWDVNI